MLEMWGKLIMIMNLRQVLCLLFLSSDGSPSSKPYKYIIPFLIVNVL